MRLRIRHETAYTYTGPATRAIETLRLTPRGHDGQFIVDWRIDVNHDCRLAQTVDPFGNMMHTFTAEGPLDGLVVTAEGRIETSDTHGVVSGQVERFPPAIFLRNTLLTTSDAAIRDFAGGIAASAGGDPLTLVHALMTGISEGVEFKVDATDTGTSASEAFKLGRGVCQDFAHILISAARHLGLPARYVSGYLCRTDYIDQGSGHAWAEVLIDRLGWVGFDAANSISPTDAYVRLAVGLDYLDAAPVRGVRYGGEGETLAVRVEVENAGPNSGPGH